MLASPNLIGFSKQFFKGEQKVFYGNNGGFRSHQGADDGCHPGVGRFGEGERQGANKELEDGYHYGPVRSSSQFIPCSHKTAFPLQ